LKNCFFMGLDLVELIVRFEDAFGIAIPDKVAAELTTPGRVADYLVSQLQLSDQTACMTQQAFYLLRREFVSVLGIQRAEFHPAARLNELIPAERRKQIWTRIGSQIGVGALPDLVRPPWLFSLLSMVTILTGLVVFNYAGGASSGAIAFLLGSLVAGLVGYVSALLTRPLKREFREEYSRAADLAKYLAMNSPHTFKKVWTREEVVETVREIIIDQTAVHEFTEDSRFVQDMHLD
jgi:hypothetical protein